jgi:hypothetical protein
MTNRLRWMVPKSSLSDFLLLAQRMLTQGNVNRWIAAAAWAVARHKAGAQHRQQLCHGWPDDLSCRSWAGFVCRACCKRGAEVRPEINLEQRARRHDVLS